MLSEAAERELKRKAILAQMSPIQLLKLLDESLSNDLERVLEVDYFTLFEQSAELLKRLYSQFDQDLSLREKLQWEIGQEPNQPARLPSLLALAFASDRGQMIVVAERLVGAVNTLSRK
ncbi:hypothetical protein B0H67DRAFT_393515 [Lasiosphaeris hirsuta]|uniref:Uncharacterized protein n=1 Tax=Lasiosphaeris hirsuta TaxID=260670 RepID=A0AA39ZRK8_9PEZI|nr:hypothetical protein B0H67DRAFT_393515 [Lasiosphaeris hirsuta]